MKWLTVSAALLFCCAATSDANAFFHHRLWLRLRARRAVLRLRRAALRPRAAALRLRPAALRPRLRLLRQLLRSGPGSCSVVLRSGPGSGCSQLLRSGPDLRLQRGSQLRLWLQCGS